MPNGVRFSPRTATPRGRRPVVASVERALATQTVTALASHLEHSTPHYLPPRPPPQPVRWSPCDGAVRAGRAGAPHGERACHRRRRTHRALRRRPGLRAAPLAASTWHRVAQLDLLFGLDQPIARLARSFDASAFGAPLIPAVSGGTRLDSPELVVRVAVRTRAPTSMSRPGTGSGRTAHRGPHGPDQPPRRCGSASSPPSPWHGAPGGGCGLHPGDATSLELATALRHWVGPGDLAEALASFETRSARRLAADGDKTNATGLDAKSEVLRAGTAPSGHDVPRALDRRARGLWRSDFVGRFRRTRPSASRVAID